MITKFAVQPSEASNMLLEDAWELVEFESRRPMTQQEIASRM